MVQKCQELMKDVHKYNDDLSKKHKAVSYPKITPAKEQGSVLTVLSIAT